MDPQPLTSPSAHTSTPAVLIVDDDEQVRTLLARWCAALGYVVSVANNADMALAAMLRTSIHVAICDTRMLGRSGTALIEYLRANHPETAIIISTGLVQRDSVLTRGPSVTAYLQKPFAFADLTAALASAVMARGLTPP